MKHSFKLSAACLLLSTGLFAAVPATHIDPVAPSIKNVVRFTPMSSKRGVEIKLESNAPGKAIVRIYNWNNEVIWREALSPKRGMDKAFILSQLGNGNYTLTVTLNKQVVKKLAHVYYRGDTKFVSIKS